MFCLARVPQGAHACPHDLVHHQQVLGNGGAIVKEKVSLKQMDSDQGL